MSQYCTKPLIEYMKTVPDFRMKGKTRHDLAEVLVCLVVGFLAGMTTIRRCLKWCNSHIQWLQQRMDLKNGIVSLSTASRILSGVDEELFSYAFMEWVGEIVDTKGIHIVIDGKALRGSTDKMNGGRAPMILNAVDSSSKLVLAQMPIPCKDCEITEIPKLLGLLDIRDSVITIDAIGTQTTIMDQIVAQGGNFVMTVKGNQPSAYKEINTTFRELSADYEKIKTDKDAVPQYPELMGKYEETASLEKNKDRYEYRTCRVCQDNSILTKAKEEWPWIKTVGQCKQVRIPMERDDDGNDITPDLSTFMEQGSKRRPQPVSGDDKASDILSVGLVSNMPLSAGDMAKNKRDHWVIENCVHHILDEDFREDRSTAKASKNNLALIRKFAYNILRIAGRVGACSKSITEARDDFSSDLSLMETYVFSGILSLY
ncbi:MAG: ISAs1 family transposase [Clostridia bacterium]|nr:ISAs1 family transposase [Clostridia bacterium]